MEKISKALHIVLALSLASHIFCCVLPTLVSMMSLFAALGFLSSYLPALEFIHEAIHQYEYPIIVGSMIALALGWASHFISVKIDCHDTGCHHGACEPKKKRTTKILVIASFLLIFNGTMVVFVG